MFPVEEHRSLEGFSLNAKKMTYLLAKTIYPYFREILVEDIQMSNFVLAYDETTYSAGVKELQIRLLYWLKEQKLVINLHPRTYYLGHATCEDLSKTLLQCVEDEGLPLERLLMLTSDGPTVNKIVRSIFDLENKDTTVLLNMGTYNIHTVHNAFQKGLQELGRNVLI